MKKQLTFWNIFPSSLILLGILLLLGRVLIRRRSKDPEEAIIIDQDPEEGTQVDEPDEFTQDQLIRNNYLVIRNTAPDNIPDEFCKVLTAQAMHETGIFKSRLYREQNNLFGMRQPTIRETTSTGEIEGYANFASLEDSVRDLLLWFEAMSINPTLKKYNTTKGGINDYLKEIKERGYFTDNYINYFNAVRSHTATVKNLIQ